MGLNVVLVWLEHLWVFEGFEAELVVGAEIASCLLNHAIEECLQLVCLVDRDVAVLDFEVALELSHSSGQLLPCGLRARQLILQLVKLSGVLATRCFLLERLCGAGLHDRRH